MQQLYLLGTCKPALSPGGQPAAGEGSLYGVTPLSPSIPGLTGSYPIPSSVGQSITGTTEQKFPERPSEPECQYYLKMGNCIFGASCKYHHPPHRGASAVPFLGPLGLPLHPKICARLFTSGVGHGRGNRPLRRWSQEWKVELAINFISERKGD